MHFKRLDGSYKSKAEKKVESDMVMSDAGPVVSMTQDLVLRRSLNAHEDMSDNHYARNI